VTKVTIDLVEAGWMPDFVVRAGIRSLNQARLREQKPTGALREKYKMEFIEGLKQMPIAIDTHSANEQHYEVPPSFFVSHLGPCLKYSSCYFGYGDGDSKQQQNGISSIKTLHDGEIAMLKLYVERAQLKVGQKVLDLGCGWGSLSLWLAAQFPKSQITAVSNSKDQQEFIREQCKIRKLQNITLIKSDINDLHKQNLVKQFDRVVSIEMLEHCKNYEKAFNLISNMLKDDGLVFIHVFSHKDYPYHFEVKGDDDWMTKQFFQGGTMPSHDLFMYFQNDIVVDKRWVVNGRNYAQTSEFWLQGVDAKLSEVQKIFAQTYGAADSYRWVMRWRMFYLAVAELFATNNGEEWFVSHYLFSKRK